MSVEITVLVGVLGVFLSLGAFMFKLGRDRQAFGEERGQLRSDVTHLSGEVGTVRTRVLTLEHRGEESGRQFAELDKRLDLGMAELQSGLDMANQRLEQVLSALEQG